jgi:hypothetical protein
VPPLSSAGGRPRSRRASASSGVALSAPRPVFKSWHDRDIDPPAAQPAPRKDLWTLRPVSRGIAPSDWRSRRRPSGSLSYLGQSHPAKPSARRGLPRDLHPFRHLFLIDALPMPSSTSFAQKSRRERVLARNGRADRMGLGEGLGPIVMGHVVEPPAIVHSVDEAACGPRRSRAACARSSCFSRP